MLLACNDNVANFLAVERMSTKRGKAQFIEPNQKFFQPFYFVLRVWCREEWIWPWPQERCLSMQSRQRLATSQIDVCCTSILPKLQGSKEKVRHVGDRNRRENASWSKVLRFQDSVRESTNCEAQRKGKPREKGPLATEKKWEAKRRPSCTVLSQLTGLRDDLLQHFINNTKNTHIRCNER